jgi:undecaprenyl diphosphate synthase
MDGNATWASRRSASPMSGYAAGIKVASDVVIASRARHIKYLTFYAFSSENWGRPETWISAFMELMMRFFADGEFIQKILDAGAKLKMIGDKSKLSPELQRIMNECEERSQDNRDILVQLAVSYGGKDEIVRTAQKMAKLGIDFTEENISAHLDTAGIPDPQLIIRTGGKHRLSNFLLWQASYSELYFTDVLWPDFDDAELDKAIHEFTKRERTYGR